MRENEKNKEKRMKKIRVVKTERRSDWTGVR